MGLWCTSYISDVHVRAHVLGISQVERSLSNIDVCDVDYDYGAVVLFYFLCFVDSLRFNLSGY